MGLSIIMPEIKKYTPCLYAVGQLLVYPPPRLRTKDKEKERIEYITQAYHDFVLKKFINRKKGL